LAVLDTDSDPYIGNADPDRGAWTKILKINLVSSVSKRLLYRRRNDFDPIPALSSVRTHDILVQIRMRIRILGSAPLTNGSGCGADADPTPDPVLFLSIKMPTKNNFSLSVLMLFPVEDTFTSFFKDKRSYRSHKTVDIKVFLPFFAC
jgi:hypothetical protein